MFLVCFAFFGCDCMLGIPLLAKSILLSPPFFHVSKDNHWSNEKWHRWGGSARDRVLVKRLWWGDGPGYRGIRGELPNDHWKAASTHDRLFGNAELMYLNQTPVLPSGIVWESPLCGTHGSMMRHHAPLWCDVMHVCDRSWDLRLHEACEAGWLWVFHVLQTAWSWGPQLSF